MHILSIWEITIEVSVMILLIGLIRRLLHRQLAADFQYFLWIFVALRILLPIGMAVEVDLPQELQGTVVGSILAVSGTNEELTSANENGMETAENGSVGTEAETMLASEPSGAGLHADIDLSGAGLGTDGEWTGSEVSGSIGVYSTGVSENDGENISDIIANAADDSEVDVQADTEWKAGVFILRRVSDFMESGFFFIWLAGGIFLSLCMLIGNVRLFRRLKCERRLIGRLKNSGLPVYSVSGCYCLAGVLHPAIYVDTGEIRDEAVIYHIIRHEREHYRAHDNLWQLVRSVCLILQWHNPLVWWAYFASKKDCELACDFRSVRRMDDKKRYAYGQSLLAVCGSSISRGISLTTAMGGSRKFMEERIVGVMKPKRQRTAALSAVIVVIVVLIGIVSVQLNAEGSLQTQGTVEDGGQGDVISTDGQNGAISDGDQSAEDAEATMLRVDIQIEDYYITNTGDPYNLYYIDENHVLWGSGYNTYGQLGQGIQDEEYHTEFVKIAEDVVHVDYSSLGGFVIYLTRDHELYGLGASAGGALLQSEEFSWESYSHKEESALSTPVLLMKDVAYASCGREDVACLTEDGDVFIWGMICMEDELSKYEFVAAPQKVLSDAVLVTGGLYNHAALLQDGTVWTWGYNYAGNCGVEISLTNSYIPEPVCVAGDAVMVWTGGVSRNVNCLDITEFDGVYPRGMQNTIIRKKDGSYWACGVDVGEEERTLPGFWLVADYVVVCSDEFMELTQTPSHDLPYDQTFDSDVTSYTKRMELSPQDAWESLQESILTQYSGIELEESGEELLAVLGSETDSRDDGTKLYSWKRVVVYMGEKYNRLFFANYYVFIGNNGEEWWLRTSNLYYVSEYDGSCGTLATN